MDFRSQHYFDASLERMAQARDLYDKGGHDLALSMYAAGVAAECMLRAFIARRSSEFEGRHDILLLYDASNMWRIDPALARSKKLTESQIDEYRLELNRAIQVIHRLWHNNYRYASEKRLRAHLRRIGANAGIKGDSLKENARKLRDAASKLVQKGALLWTPSPTK